MKKPTAVFIHARKPPFTHLLEVELEGGKKERLPATLTPEPDGRYALSFPREIARFPRLATLAKELEGGHAERILCSTVLEFGLCSADERVLYYAECVGRSLRARCAEVHNRHGTLVGLVFCYKSTKATNRRMWEPSTAMFCTSGAVNLPGVLTSGWFSPFAGLVWPIPEGAAREAGEFTISLSRKPYWELPATFCGRHHPWQRVKGEWRTRPEYYF